MSDRKAECRQLYQRLIDLLDEDVSGGKAIYYIRALEETQRCDQVYDYSDLRQCLYRNLNRERPGAIERILTHDYELEDRFVARDIIGANRAHHQSALARGLSWPQWLWQRSGRRIEVAFRSSESRPYST